MNMIVKARRGANRCFRLGLELRSRGESAGTYTHDRQPRQRRQYSGPEEEEKKKKVQTGGQGDQKIVQKLGKKMGIKGALINAGKLCADSPST